MFKKVIAIDAREAKNKNSGKGKYTFEITQALIKNKNNKFLLLTDKKLEDFPDAENLSQIIINAKGVRWHLKVLHFLAKNQKFLQITHYFAITSFIMPAFMNIFCKKFKNINLYLFVHDLIVWKFPNKHSFFASFVEKLFLKSALKKAQKIICVSRSTQNDLNEIFPFTKQKQIIIASPAVSEEFYKDSEFYKNPKNNFIANKKYILAVANFIPRKNYSLIFSAFTNLSKVHNDLHLIVVGEKLWNNPDFDKIFPHELSKKIHFFNKLTDSDLRKLYSHAICLFFPSLYEGFGMPILEAMSCECPVVAGNNSSMKDLVEPDGFLVSTDKIDQSVQIINNLINTPNQYKEITQCAKLKAKNFSWEKSANIILT